MHGGDIYRNKIEYDFSVNINPAGISRKVRDALIKSVDSADTYPDIKNQELKKRISKRYNLESECILCGNGASELINAFCTYRKPERVLMIAPSFSGYENAVLASGGKCHYYTVREDNQFLVGEDILKEIDNIKPDMMFLTNPNNPTGRMVDFYLMDRIVKLCERISCMLIIDECFIELTAGNNISYLNYVKGKGNTVVLRAFTKSFAIPGVRIGYAICSNKDLAGRIEAVLPEWNISVFATSAAIAALEENDYLEKSGKLILRERNYLYDNLQRYGFVCFESDANFILFKADDSIDWFMALLKKNILIRDCSDFKGLGKGYYRIAVKTRKENEKLVEAIGEVLHLEKH